MNWKKKECKREWEMVGGSKPTAEGYKKLEVSDSAFSHNKQKIDLLQSPDLCRNQSRKADLT